MIAILSIQHTGTWFTIKYLENITGNKCTLSSDFKEGDRLTHCHIYGNGQRFTNVRNVKCPDLLDVIDFYYSRGYKIVIPFRDPLLSIITRQNRHPELNHMYIIESFELLSLVDKAHYFAFPIDLHSNDEDRQTLLKRLCEFVGKKYIQTDWQPVESTADNTGLKKAYYEKEYGKLMDALGPYLTELRQKNYIHSLLERLGYKIWWL